MNIELLKLLKVPLHIFMTTFSFCISIYTFANIENEAYKLMPLMPLVFIICYWIYLYRSIVVPPYFFRITFLIISFLRYVVLPLLIVVTNKYDGTSIYLPFADEFELAIILMMYELIACTLTIMFFDKVNLKRKKVKLVVDKNVPKKNITFSDNNFIYKAFLLFTLFLVSMSPSSLKYFTFLIPKESGLGVDFSSTGIMSELAIICLIAGKSLLFLYLMILIYKKYLINKKYILLALLVLIINSVIYYGQNRSAFVFSLCASLYLFIKLYPEHKKKLLAPITLVVSVVLVLMTNSRNYYDYYSNETGLAKNLLQFQHTISQYFGGINNVAVGIQTNQMYGSHDTLINFIYDIFRPVIGFNVFLKNLPLEYSNVYYNYTYFLSEDVVVIFPTIAQGYFYFGLILSPLISVLLIMIAIFLEKLIVNTNKIEYLFLFIPSLFRLGTLSGANLNLQMNDLSIQLLIPMIVVLLNEKVVLNKGVRNVSKINRT